MPKDNGQTTETTKEQLSDVYAAGTSDGIMKTQDGLIRIDEDGSLHEHAGEEHDD